ncbi:MAG: hypothetical protein LBE92_11575 [Chryseobacterium sp.]|jgi:hypothetical protein|uniref:hypothetical protein n=1 Tax=Chryseobacterium sp. TaxID=1871047 RepID=UPI002817A7ED|nr:hypothetical protein [Chryseobacterium sp.]MDR2236753.1 hypothetical protein [Chryseobacterium sp.]
MKNTFVFPFLSIMLIMIFSCKEPVRKKTDFPNDLKNTHWIVDAGGLISPDGGKNYNLSPRVDTALIFNFHAIDFPDEEKFRSYDSWQCGNDCFTEVYGRYYFTEINRIEMEVDSIRKSGECEAPVKIFKPAEKMSFLLKKEGKQLQLIRK